MRTLFLAFFIFCAAIFHTCCADFIIPHLIKIESVSFYQGDSKGAFKNELVANLTDGSGWKIHKTREEKFSRWDVDDVIHVGVRKSWYWFKREHKFQLVNHTKKEVIKVMLVRYPQEPLTIIYEEIKIYQTTYHPYTCYDSSGCPYVISIPHNHYVKCLVLSDHTVWYIYEEFSEFALGNRVYVGTHLQDKDSFYFLIKGIERSAHYIKAYKR